MRTIFDVYIVDDDLAGIKILKQALAGEKELNLCGNSSQPEEALLEIDRLQPDLLFLDMEMPGLSGLELLKEIRSLSNWPMRVVFYTSYQKYLIDALRESAFDFLLKPFVKEELDTILSRFYENPPNIDEINSGLQILNKYIPVNKPIWVPSARGTKTMRPAEICFFEYSRISRSWYLYPEKGPSIKLKRETTAEYILSVLPTFIRISQQQILNPEKINKFECSNCYLNAPYDKEKLFPVSRECIKSVRSIFDSI